MLKPDPEHWNTQLTQRTTDLTVIPVGGNDLQEKGMGNEEIINILLEGANRKKQASGGIVGQLHMNKGGSVTTPKRGLVNEAGSYAGVRIHSYSRDGGAGKVHF